MTHSWRAALAALAVAGTLLCGCDDQSSQALIASAQSHLEKGETRSAVIQLKNALQKDPESAQASLLLGRTLLATGDAASATPILRKAASLHAPDAQVLPLLARALNMEGHADETTKRFADVRLSDPAAAADLKTSLARAYLLQGNADAAEHELQQALELAPNATDALILKARSIADKHDFDDALGLARNLVRQAPNNEDVWQLEGDLLLFAKTDPAGAIDAYRKALAIRPALIPAHAGIISILLAKDDLTAARAQLDAFEKLAPNHPQARYFEARLALARKDYKTAGEIAQQLRSKTPDDPRVLQLAGAVELETGSTDQAERSLGKALQAMPEDAQTRQLLVRTYLQSARPALALATLAPLMNEHTTDAAILTLAAQARFQSHDNAEAEALLARASKADPGDPRGRTALALTQLAKGDADAALGELRRIASSDPGATADLALTGAMLRAKDIDGALKALASLERKQPRNPLVPALRGRIQASGKRLPEARESFERALAIDPACFPATAGLAALDFIAGHPEQSAKRFEAVLSRDPNNLEALQALADLKEASGGSDEEVAAMYGRAVKLNPTQAAPRLALFAHYLKKRDFKHAVTAAQDGVAALPESAPMLEALGRAQMESGDLNQALVSFNRLIALQPDSAQPYLRVADVYAALKSSGQAIQALKRAIAAAPEDLAVQGRLIALEAQGGHADEALALARAVQAKHPRDAAGYLFEGDLAASLNQGEAAATAFRNGLKNAASSDLAQRFHAVLLSSGKQPEAEKFAAGWMKEHPGDAAFLFHLGDAALDRKDLALAEARYRGVLAVAPDNALALNNVAWIMAKRKDPGALAFAQQASRLQPDRPEFMDTQAGILVQDRQFDKAIALQKKAIELRPQNYAYQLNLARAYATAGSRELAKAELEQLSQLGPKFADQAEVAALLATL